MSVDSPPVETQQNRNAPRHRSRLRLWTARLAIMCFAVLLALFVAEIALRLFVEQELRRSAIYDRDLGWRGRPHAKGLYVRRQDGIRNRFQYNNLGYRDEDVVPRTDDEVRILLLGDSFLENLEVKYDEVFHERLENELNADPGHNHSVIAIGSQGYSNAQELLAFRRYKDEIDADVVLTVFYTGNDFDDNVRPRFAYLDEAGALVFPPNNESNTQFRVQAFKRWIYETSHLVYLVKNQVQSLANVNLRDPSKDIGEVDESEKRKITLAILSQMKTEIEASGAKPGIVIIPSRDELAANDTVNADLVAKFCTENEITFLNLAELLTVDDYFKSDFHFTIDGHKRVADKMYAFLRDSFADVMN